MSLEDSFCMVGHYEVGGFTGENSMAVSGLGCRPSVGPQLAVHGLAMSVLFGMRKWT